MANMNGSLRMSRPATYTVSAVRRRKRRPQRAPQIQEPKDVYNLISPLIRDGAQEYFYGVYLNTKNRVLAVELISVGTLNASLVHPREVFAPAFHLRAASIVVAHNHPSGDPEPSIDDLAITRRLQEGGNLLGIDVLDHVIVSVGGWVSLLREEKS